MINDFFVNQTTLFDSSLPLHVRSLAPGTDPEKYLGSLLQPSNNLTSPQRVCMAKILRGGSMGPATVGGLEPRSSRCCLRPWWAQQTIWFASPLTSAWWWPPERKNILTTWQLSTVELRDSKPLMRAGSILSQEISSSVPVLNRKPFCFCRYIYFFLKYIM